MNFERITLSSNSLRIEVIPELGGKIASMRLLPSEEELLQQPLLPYAPRNRTMAFEEGDASGIDDCIPTVSGCDIETGEGTLPLPDHGDFWRVPFRHRIEGEELVLGADGFSLPFRLEKRLRLKENRLYISYRLQNIGDRPVPYLWSAHPGFKVEEGDRILMPASVPEITVWYSGGLRLGQPGRVHSWPRTRSLDGAPIDLSRVGGPQSGVGDKVFFPAPAEGWVAVDRRRLQQRIEMRFDPADSPYVGLWMAYGGWPDGAAQRQHCVALEPCTAAADSLAAAIARGWARTLAAGAQSEWAVEIRVIPA